MLAALRARASEIEAARRLPSDLSDRFARAGFYRMCVPETYGGLELPPADTMQTIELLATADGASAWCVFIAATSGTVLAQLSETTAREIFSHPETMIAGVFAPRGRAEAVAGGFRVAGEWAWGSGTQNADWILAGCQLTSEVPPDTPSDGRPRSHMVIVPASEVAFRDTWFVSGLCGTGSTDFAIDDVFVPTSRVVGLEAREKGAQARPELPRNRPLYAFPQFGLLGMGIAAVALGLARAAIDEVVGLAGEKQPTGSTRSLAARPAAQADVARAEAETRAARAFYYEAIEAAWREALAGAITLERRRDLRLATSHATWACAQAIDRMYHLAGGSSVYARSPLQRIFRDIHVATQHMMVGPATFELTGRLFLGLETDTSML